MPGFVGDLVDFLPVDLDEAERAIAKKAWTPMAVQNIGSGLGERSVGQEKK